MRCGGNRSVKGACYEPALSAQLGSTCWKIKWSCLLYLFLECNWKELFLFLRHCFLVFCHPWTIMTMQTTTDNWRISPWSPSLTASLCHRRAWGCNVGSRFLLPTSLVSGLMRQQFYMCLQKRQLHCDSTSFLCSSSSNRGSSPVLPDAAQLWNNRWPLPARTCFEFTKDDSRLYTATELAMLTPQHEPARTKQLWNRALSVQYHMVSPKPKVQNPCHLYGLGLGQPSAA